MDYEKKYKEAITAIDDLISLLRKHEVISSDGIIVSNLQRIFPELIKVKIEKLESL